MPKVSNFSEKLAPYAFYGLSFSNRDSGEVLTDCPFCGKSNKFSINAGNGLWRCLACNEGEGDKAVRGGNIVTFVRCLHSYGEKHPSLAIKLSELASERGLFTTSILRQWGFVVSPITGEFLVPTYHFKTGQISNLYRYAYLDGKKRLLSGPKPILSQQLFGRQNWSDSKPLVYICEGPWDGMVLQEVLNLSTSSEDGGLKPCNSSHPQSLAASTNVIAVPGCGAFKKEWVELLRNRDTIIFFDNDHPKPSPDNKSTLPPASLSGIKKIAEIVSEDGIESSLVSYLKWGNNGYDLSLKSGTDLRDVFLSADGGGPLKSLNPRRKAFLTLMSKVSSLESEWLKEPTRSPGGDDRKKIELLPCESYKALITSWRKALKWTEGLDYALSCMLASVASVRLVGDQLWLKVIGPASCGKSTLCEALSTNPDFILAKSTMRGFHSGFGEGSEDNSLLNVVRNKTLITKDGDTLLQSPNLSQILSEARDVYDTVSRTSYRNKNSRDYVGVRMTWLLCGTSSLRSIDSSELGERFLDVVIMEGIDDDLEDEILTRVAHRVARNLKLEVGESTEVQQDPEMAEAMGMTGGYVTYLRENVKNLMEKLEVPDSSLHYCTRLGKFVAFMRARPSSRQDETAEREFAARLVSQHIRLANCLAVVMNRPSLDAEVLKRVRKVALDTARGKTLDIARYLYEAEDGLEPRSIAMYISQPESEVRHLLRFLKRIGVVEVQMKKAQKGFQSKPAWYLTPKLRKLWEQVCKEE